MDYVPTGYEPFDVSTLKLSTLTFQRDYPQSSPWRFPRILPYAHFHAFTFCISYADIMLYLFTEQMEVFRLSSTELYNRLLHSYYTCDWLLVEYSLCFTVRFIFFFLPCVRRVSLLLILNLLDTCNTAPYLLVPAHSGPTEATEAFPSP